jgi:hypothetical protein
MVGGADCDAAEDVETGRRKCIMEYIITMAIVTKGGKYVVLT